jgi:hypothetical protein
MDKNDYMEKTEIKSKKKIAMAAQKSAGRFI